MRVRPIPFSAPMVRALNRKTQTRRIIRGQEEQYHYSLSDGRLCRAYEAPSHAESCRAQFEVGDVLYVREAWRVAKCFDRIAPKIIPHETALGDTQIFYEADADFDDMGWGKLRQGMFIVQVDGSALDRGH